MFLAELLLLLALILASVGTWLAPLLGIYFYHRSLRQSHPRANQVEDSSKKSLSDLSLDILIPAHHERLSLPKTLSYFQKLKSFNHSGISKIRTLVALSNWSDPEAFEASVLADKVLQVSESGKWKAIVKLIEESNADWIALVDSGTIWSDGALENFIKIIQEPQVIAVNPTYKEYKRTALIQRCVWIFESYLKKIENFSGGPISLHGATIFYRRTELTQAIQYLNGQEWLNDDVVIPLAIRSLYPHNKIIYTSAILAIDLFPSSNEGELPRRKRVLYGNIQWMAFFLKILYRENITLFCLALRRLSRLIWAWWILLFTLGFLWLSYGLDQAKVILALYGCLFLLMISFSSGRRFLEAFRVSLFLPFYLRESIIKKSNKQIQWK